MLIKILTALAVGWVASWLASLASLGRRERPREAFLDPLAGFVGAPLGSFVVSPVSGTGGARPASLTVTHWFLRAVPLVALIDPFNRYIVR